MSAAASSQIKEVISGAKPASNEGDAAVQSNSDIENSQATPSSAQQTYVVMCMLPSSATVISNSNSEQHSTLFNGSKTVPDNAKSSSLDVLTNRVFTRNPKVDESSLSNDHVFTIASYNILASCHIRPGLYPHAALEVLSQTNRHKRLLVELRYLDADLFCLQEVDPDYFTNTLEPALKGLGYSGVFKKRVQAAYHEGGATFYKTSRFTLITTSGMVLKDLADQSLSQCSLEEIQKAAIRNYLNDPSVILITKLRCNHTMKELTVGNVHITYKGFKQPDLQCIQVACAVKELVNVAGGPQHAHILAGDFNTQPSWPVFQLARDGYLNDENIEKLQQVKAVTFPDGRTRSLVNLWGQGFNHTSPNLQSAYVSVKGTEVAATCDELGEKCVLDYILIGDKSLLAVAVVEPVDVSAEHLPSELLPSDHLSICTKLCLV